MIIFFSDPKDFSTSKILEWLININNKEVIVINTSDESDDFISIKTLTNRNVIFTINNRDIKEGEIEAIYFRRNGIKLPKIHSNNHKLKLAIKDYVYSNLLANKEMISHFLKNKRTFGNDGIGRVNKIILLKEAEKAGFLIPEYIVTTSKKDLIKFINKNKEVVVKALDIGFNDIDEMKGVWKVGYTTLIEKKQLKLLPNNFPLSFFQKKINKSFEIRCFYFHSNFFAVAIFSQNNQKTKLDYRRYDPEVPNREIPIVLSKDLKDKIEAIFTSVKLNTGSIDIIVNGDLYYFLEINPVGQFENVSSAGNWYIEKKIADFLSNKN